MNYAKWLESATADSLTQLNQSWVDTKQSKHAQSSAEAGSAAVAAVADKGLRLLTKSVADDYAERCSLVSWSSDEGQPTCR